MKVLNIDTETTCEPLHLVNCTFCGKHFYCGKDSADPIIIAKFEGFQKKDKIFCSNNCLNLYLLKHI